MQFRLKTSFLSRTLQGTLRQKIQKTELIVSGIWKRVSARQADDFSAPEMTVESAMDLLGVKEGASFDEILRAKKEVIDRSIGDEERLIQVEVAYDLLLMQSLSKRRAGNVIDSSVRFADVRRARPAATSSTPDWLQKAMKTSPVAIETPAANDLALQGAVFGGLALWTAAAGAPSGQSDIYTMSATGADIPGLQLALGFGASLYFLRQQSVKLGKAALVTGAALIVGTVLGSLMEAWLHVEIFPVLGISSQAVLISEFAFLTLFLSSAFLR